MTVSMEYTPSALAEYFRGLGAGLARADFTKELRACAVLISADLKDRLAKGVSPDNTPFLPLAHPRPNGKASPLWDSGALARSVGSGVNHVEKVGPLSLELGTAQEGAETHQFGATITPKKGKYLAIPLTMQAKRAGSPRNFPAPLAGVFGKKGGVLIQKGKGRKKDVVHFALTTKAVIPPRPFLGFSAPAMSACESILLAGMAGRVP